MAEFIQKTDTLNQGREKLNAAITDAEKAKVDAGKAVDTSNQARQIAQTAENKADSVQAQFDQVVIEGDSSVEAAQARVDTKGNSHSTLKARLDAEHTEVTAQLADTAKVVNVRSFGAIGDGIADDTTPIKNAFKYAIENKMTRVVFDRASYRYTENITIRGFDKLIIEGNGAELIDSGKLIGTSQGLRRNPLGFAFENFNELHFNDFIIATDGFLEAFGTGTINNASDKEPVLSFDGRENDWGEQHKGIVFLNRIITRGQGGTYVNPLQQTNIKDALRASFIRAVYLKRIVCDNAEMESTSGGTEMFCFGKCENVEFRGFRYVRTGESRPISIGKFIDCDNQLLENMYIICNDHSPDCFDLSAKNQIIIRNSHVDYNGGDRFEITSEWEQFNIDIGDVYIDNVTGRSRDFNQTQLPVDPQYDNKIKSMTVTNCDIKTVYLASNYYAAKTTFENCLIEITENVEGQSQHGIRTYGDTSFVKCEIKTTLPYCRVHPRANQRHLTNGYGKLTIKDSSIEQLQLWNLDNDVDNIDVEIINSNLVYEDRNQTYIGVRLSKPIKSLLFDTCKISGSIGAHSSFITDATNSQNFIKKLMVKNCDIDIVRGASTVTAFATVDAGRFEDQSVYIFENNTFGKFMTIMGFNGAGSSVSSAGGCLLILQNNTYLRKETSTFAMSDTMILDSIDMIFRNNVFNGAISEARQTQLSNLLRKFINQDNVQLV